MVRFFLTQIPLTFPLETGMLPHVLKDDRVITWTNVWEESPNTCRIAIYDNKKSC